MLLYALDEPFYIFDQVKWQRGIDERLIVAYEILCLSVLRCTKWWHGSEKKGMPGALSLLNISDTHHLKCLVWAVYNGALLVGRQPELPGNCQWYTVLVGLYRHIYWGCNDAAHCSLYTLASWDCQERTEALRHKGKLGSAWSGHKRASRSRRRSRSSSRHHSRMPALRVWSGHSCCLLPNMPLRCYCGEPLSPGADTMPKLPSAVNIPAYTHRFKAIFKWQTGRTFSLATKEEWKSRAVGGGLMVLRCSRPPPCSMAPCITKMCYAKGISPRCTYMPLMKYLHI